MAETDLSERELERLSVFSCGGARRRMALRKCPGVGEIGASGGNVGGGRMESREETRAVPDQDL